MSAILPLVLDVASWILLVAGGLCCVVGGVGLLRGARPGSG